VLPIYDAPFQQDKVSHILVRHEQGAVHAAEGYARSTGKVGCVLVTSGPGATTPSPASPMRCAIDPARRHHRAGADPPHRQ
jgi:glyoxylate carboligase